MNDTFDKNFKFYIGFFLLNTRGIFPFNKFRSYYKNKIIRRNSDVCIEGFHRSGNSFFVRIFSRANKDLKHSSPHAFCCPSQTSNKMEDSRMVLIRQPEDVIASLLTWDDRLSVGVAIRSYIRFYKGIFRLRKKIFISSFEMITIFPDLEIDRLNVGFGAKFDLTEYDEGNISEFITKHDKRFEDPLTSPFPNETKKKKSVKHRKEVLEHPLYLKASGIYLDLLEYSWEQPRYFI